MMSIAPWPQRNKAVKSAGDVRRNVTARFPRADYVISTRDIVSTRGIPELHLRGIEDRLERAEALIKRLKRDNGDPRAILVARPEPAEPLPAFNSSSSFGFDGNNPVADDFEWDEQDSSERIDNYLGTISAGAQNTDLVPDGMASLPVSEKEAGYLGVASGAALLRIMEPKKIRRNSRSRTHRTSSSSFTTLGLCSAPDPNRHIGDAMLDAYFRRYHLSYPIIHEATFRAQYAEVIPQPHGKCWQILAYTIAAIGVYTSSDTASNSLDLDLFAQARSMLSFDHLELGNLTLVQALTLISNYQQKRDKPNSGYNYLGLAVRMATGLGLHKEFTGWKISPLQMEIRRRVWWSLCVFDVGATITFSRPTVWPYEGVEVAFPLNVTDRDLTANSKSYPSEREAITPYTSVGLQAKFHIATNRIYSRVISKPFATAEELRNLEDDLLAPWLAKLPEWFREDSVVEPRYALAHAVMQWRYRNFRIIMYRPFVIRMALATGRNGRMINNASAAEVHAYNQCLADADVTIKSISKYWMTNEHNRLAAWYALYFLFQAALIPCICLRNMPLSPEAPSWCDQVSLTLRTIRALSPANASCSSCQDVIVDLCGRYLNQNTANAGADPPMSPGTGRDSRYSQGGLGDRQGVHATRQAFSTRPSEPSSRDAHQQQQLLGPIDESPQTQINQVFPMMWPNVNALEAAGEVLGNDAWMSFLDAP
ncbi:fungal-specific transcription factor domain-containing protein [Diaporthe eres]|nr:fungal-specific transcription factor domain-containing protein [Diaporthe eres]